MATRALQSAPLEVALATILSQPPAVLSRLTTRLIDRLDMLAGDPDLEPNGDELDGNPAEDEFCVHRGDGPGCPIADPDCAVDDRGCDENSEDGI